MSVETENRQDPESENHSETSFTHHAFTRLDAAGSDTGFALWQSVKGEWLLFKCECVEGFEAVVPPENLGKYEGEIIRKACELTVM